MKKKSFSNIYLLYCLSDTIHIHVISICKFFVVKFVLVLAFFIHLMVIGLYFFFIFFLKKDKFTTKSLQTNMAIM